MTNRLIKNGELCLYGTVGGSWWDEEYFTASEVNGALEEMSGDIVVRLNSGGGSAFQGIAIQNALLRYDGEVTVSVEALAASAASVIAMAGDDVVMQPGSMMMIHDPSSITFGTAEEHERTAVTPGDYLNLAHEVGSSIVIEEPEFFELSHSELGGPDEIAGPEAEHLVIIWPVKADEYGFNIGESTFAKELMYDFDRDDVLECVFPDLLSVGYQMIFNYTYKNEFLPS